MRINGVIDKKTEVNYFLEKQFGTTSDLEFKEMGKRRIYAYKSCKLNIKTYHYGIYFGRLENTGIRLTIEGSQLVGPSAKRGVFEVEHDAAIRWMSGEDIESDSRGYIIVKWSNYFLGCGKGNGEKIRNFIPKGRRVTSSKEPGHYKNY